MIRKKLLVMMVIALASVIAMGVVSNWSSFHMERAMEKKVLLTSFLKNHVESDMHHEGIRGSVFFALREAGRFNADGVARAQQDFEQERQDFLELFKKNREMHVNKELVDALETEKNALDAYLAQAAKVISLAARDPMAAEGELPLFIQSFDALEERLGAITEKIQEEIDVSWKQSKADTERTHFMLIGLSALLLLVIGFLCFSVFNWLLTPLSNMIQTMLQLSKGNLGVEIHGADRNDEMGAMARAMDVFKENAVRTQQLDQERAAAERRAQGEKQQAMHELANRFEQRVQGIITSVASSATELLQTSQRMTSVIEDANHKAVAVSSLADRTSGNVQTVASAAEEMTASVKEIAGQVSKSTHVVAETVAKAMVADDNAKKLEGAAQQIGHVVQLIQDIAEQINLLALNATIESARAGDAGKGFAVVASEVKNLATQTTKATEEIAVQIEGIQSISKGVVEALNAIKLSIDHVNEYAGGIASAVEEQSAVTDEIAVNMQTAASGTSDIRANIGEVTTSATAARDSAVNVLEASRALSVQAETLSREVADFLSEVRG